MENVYWDPVKNVRLKKVRGASFEEDYEKDQVDPPGEGY